MYMFPRQFGLHNVFTSTLDTRETVQPFKDYTVREEEIQARRRVDPKVNVPKRLRGGALRLVQKLQILHQRCPYDELLQYHCTRQVSPQMIVLTESSLTYIRRKASLDLHVRPVKVRQKALKGSEPKSLCLTERQTQLRTSMQHLRYGQNG